MIIQTFLAQFNMGYGKRFTTIKIPYTKKNKKITEYFLLEGFIKNYIIHKGFLTIWLRYSSNKKLFIHIKNISKPGYRRYFTYNQLKRYSNFNGTNLILVETHYGLIPLTKALILKTGGEIIAELQY